MHDPFYLTFRKWLLPVTVILNDHEKISAALFTDLDLTLLRFSDWRNEK